MIYTFYSFKGGVGRSMALANVAELLYQRGARVLMVDFDLEAPGLERYFDNDMAINGPESVLKKRGLIDLVISYKDLRSLLRPTTVESDILKHEEVLREAGNARPESRESSLPDETFPSEAAVKEASDLANRRRTLAFPFPVEPLSNFVVPIYKRNNLGGKISLIPAGRRAKEPQSLESLTSNDTQESALEEHNLNEFARYSERVRSLAWDDFYMNWDGGRFFDWFQAEADNSEKFDVVLIDSRTGVTEMGGICTYHLADVVVMFSAPNYQNIDGIRKIADSLMKPQIKLRERSKRELGLVFVPSRVDLNEKKELDLFAKRFKEKLSNLNDSQLTFESDPFNDLKVPYVPFYSYHEDVAARDKESPVADALIKSFERLCRTLAQFERESGGKLATLFDVSKEPWGNIADKENRFAEQAFARLNLEEQHRARPLLKRLVRLSQPGETGSQNTRLRVSLEEFSSSEQEIVETLVQQHLVAIEDSDLGEGRIVELAQEGFAQDWDRLKEWLEQDKKFLLWRQQLRSNISQWKNSKQEKAALLSGSSLAYAKQWSYKRDQDLSGIEKGYIHASSIYQWRQRIGVGVVLLIIALTVFGALWSSKRDKNRLLEEERLKREYKAKSDKELGDVNASDGKFDSAIGFYDSAIASKPNFPEAFFARGKTYLSLAQYEKAIADLKQTLKLDPNNLEAFNTLGVAYLADRDIPSAIDTFNKLIAIRPDLAETYYHLGTAYNERGDAVSAQRNFDQAIALKPDYAEAYFERARLHQNQLEYKSAVSDLKETVRLTRIPGLELAATNALLGISRETGTPIAIPLKEAKPQVFLHYTDKKDLVVLQTMKKDLAVFNVQGIEFVTQPTVGEVRYFYKDDERNARLVSARAIASLGTQGFRRNLQVQFLGDTYQNVQRGSIEVWIPTLNQLPGSQAPPPDTFIDRTTATIVSVEGAAAVGKEAGASVAKEGMVLGPTDILILEGDPPTKVIVRCGGTEEYAFKSWGTSGRSQLTTIRKAPWCPQ
jgi:tetratricopeptide (TPR) repeat protein/MinD-like ATPase involved in chromosome partitioning or flagellar assembly